MYIHIKIIRANVDMGVDMWSRESCSQHSFLNTKKYTATCQRHHSIILSTEAIIHTDIYALFGHLFIVTAALMLLPLLHETCMRPAVSVHFCMHWYMHAYDNMTNIDKP